MRLYINKKNFWVLCVNKKVWRIVHFTNEFNIYLFSFIYYQGISLCFLLLVKILKKKKKKKKKKKEKIKTKWTWIILLMILINLNISFHFCLFFFFFFKSIEFLFKCYYKFTNIFYFYFIKWILNFIYYIG